MNNILKTTKFVLIETKKFAQNGERFNKRIVGWERNQTATGIIKEGEEKEAWQKTKSKDFGLRCQ